MQNMQYKFIAKTYWIAFPFLHSKRDKSICVQKTFTIRNLNERIYKNKNLKPWNGCDCYELNPMGIVSSLGGGGWKKKNKGDNQLPSAYVKTHICYFRISIVDSFC